MSHARRYAVFCLAMLLAVGCGKEDPKRKKLIGNWKEENGTFSLKDDGTFSGDFKPPAKLLDAPPSIHMAGTWAISGKDLTLSVEQSTYKSDKIVGKSSTEHILDIQPDTFVTENAAGKETTYTRIKK